MSLLGLSLNTGSVQRIGRLMTVELPSQHLVAKTELSLEKYKTSDSFHI